MPRSGLERVRGRGRLEALEQLVQAGILTERIEVAHCQRRPTSGRPLAVAEGDDPVAREGLRQVLGRSEHRPAQWVVAEYRLIDQVLGDGGGLVVVTGDLLHHDAALLVELDRVE